MDILELKFLLELLGFPDYRAPISKIKPNPQTKATERDTICRQLCDRELVAHNYEVTHLLIAPPGKSLLKLDTKGLPITQAELQVLKACAEGVITAAQTEVPAEERQAVIQGLADRGLIKTEKTQIREVWLTERGVEFLQQEYNPSGTTPVLSLDLLANYVRFLRKTLKEMPAELLEGSVTTVVEPQPEPEPVPVQPLTDSEILQLIRELDRQYQTENYLPIFHLRKQVQPPLSEEELNQALYRLQRNDKIELSSLQEAIAYTPEQIEAGIPQDVGGPLFFIIVT